MARSGRQGFDKKLRERKKKEKQKEKEERKAQRLAEKENSGPGDDIAHDLAVTAPNKNHPAYVPPEENPAPQAERAGED